MCKLPTYAQKLFLRDLVTSDSFILQPGKGPGAFLIVLQAQTVPGLKHHLESQGEKTIHQLQGCYSTGHLYSIWEQKCPFPLYWRSKELLKYFKTDFTESWVFPGIGVRVIKVQLAPAPDGSWASLYFLPWSRTISSSYCFIPHDLLLSWSIPIASLQKLKSFLLHHKKKDHYNDFFLNLFSPFPFFYFFFSRPCKLTVNRLFLEAPHLLGILDLIII